MDLGSCPAEGHSCLRALNGTLRRLCCQVQAVNPVEPPAGLRPVSLRVQCCTLMLVCCHLKAVGVLRCMLISSSAWRQGRCTCCLRPVDLFSRMLQKVCVDCLTILHRLQAVHLLSQACCWTVLVSSLAIMPCQAACCRILTVIGLNYSVTCRLCIC